MDRGGLYALVLCQRKDIAHGINPQAIRKPFWFCSYSTYSAEHSKWRRHFKSTKMTDKRAAWEVCRAWEQTAKIGRVKDKLTPETAREIVARGVADIFTAVNSETMPSASVRAWCGNGWTRNRSKPNRPPLSATATRWNIS